VRPELSTSNGITLGSTLVELRSAHGALRLAGTDTWQSANGVAFVDNAQRDPAPPSSRIVEIRVGTCSDL
jgi:hypothetical protein